VPYQPEFLAIVLVLDIDFQLCFRCGLAGLGCAAARNPETEPAALCALPAAVKP
jgi:hypothetical protein